MSKIFVFSEDTELAAKLIGLAASLGQPVVAVAANDADATSLSSYAVDLVYNCNGVSRPEASAKAVADLVQREEASLLLVGDTVRGRELAAMTATYLDTGLVSGAVAVEQVDGKIETTRMMYAGALLKTEVLDKLTVVTVAGGKLEKPEASGQQAPIEVWTIEVDDPVTVVSVEEIVYEGVDLNSADIIVGVGLGFDKQEDIVLADELAAACHGAVGCTRPVAEDKKWLPVEQYIGISGVNIKPSLYIATGISGQVQHMVGARDSKLIVAINKSDTAPIFKSADYGIVGDLYEIVPLLTEALKDA